ncbi:inositol monophosphatase family protein [Sinomonas sp. ASV486]|uniref:Inositol monophosphatase n=1 Tax=Sinomonas puerhi TaxID=3238584 RepID=A0AB39L6Z7_9MICC|nr:inositol monophosphatase family protein [Sinomonas sp. ASV486]MDQ4490397.1 inositol monophosphatase family protein [Sinomonas sp. ASV486]
MNAAEYPAEFLTTLLDTARRAAAAGAAVLAGRDAGVLTRSTGLAETKSSGSDWVTEFDLAAEKAVRAVLTAERPHDIVTGEEQGTSRVTEPSGFRWSIDPLDGTTNFIRDIVYYATSVAVADVDGVWLAGVVSAPALRREYWAVRGGGAWRLDAPRSAGGEGALEAWPMRLEGPAPGRAEAGSALLATGFSYDPGVRADQAAFLPGLMDGFGDMRRLGSAALDLCLVADGTHDAYGERGLNEHDFAAGALIAEEAGCWVRRPVLTSPLDGGPSDAERLGAWTCAGGIEFSGRFPIV